MVALSRSNNILDILIEQFAIKIGKSRDFVNNLIDGIEGIDQELAEKLSEHLGSTPQFWTNRDKQYSEKLQRLVDVTKDVWI